MTDFYTYLHCKPNGDPFYVGKGCGSRSHNLYQRNKQHKVIVAKYGIEIFVFPCDSEEQAFADEKQLIAQFKREGFVLANWTDGGEGPSGAVRSDETKEKMSAKLVGNTRWLGKTHSAKTKAKQSTANTGVPKSADHRAKVSKAIKSLMQSPEARARSAAGAKKQAANTPPEVRAARAAAASKAHWDRVPKEKRVVSAEVRAKISASRKGKPAWNKGISPPDEVRAKMSESGKKKVMTAEHKAKIVAAQRAPEMRARQAAAKVGRTPWNKGSKNVTVSDQKKMVAEYTESSCKQLIFKE